MFLQLQQHYQQQIQQLQHRKQRLIYQMATHPHESKSLANFQKIYQQILDRQLSITEAIYEMLEHKKSIKKIKIGLISLQKQSNEIEALKWKQKKHKKQFIKLCDDLKTYFEGEHEKQTEKNLSQMNEEISKMRKSLSEKGILLQFQGSQKQGKQHNKSQKQNLQQQQQNMNEVEHHDKRSSSYKAEEEYMQNQSNHLLDQNQEQEAQQKSEENLNKHNLSADQNKQQGQEIKQKQQQQSKQAVEKHQNKQISIRKQEPNNTQKKQNQFKHNIGLHQQEKNQNTSSKKQKQEEISTQKNQKNTTKVDIKAPALQTKDQENKINYNPQLQKMEIQKANSQQKNNERQWKQIPLPAQYLHKLNGQQMSRSQQKKLKTLPEEMDNQFYQQQARSIQRQQSQSPRKLQKYNPYIQIVKKLNKNKKLQPQARNQLESIYFNYRNKLVIVFSHYVKELKTQNFTFDAYPHSLDLKTFSLYYKYFKMGQFCKIVDIPRYFKKYAINGAYLNEEGFITIHEKIFDLGDNVLQKITALIKDKQQYEKMLQEQVKKLEQLGLNENEKKIKQTQMFKKKDDFGVKYNEFKQKLQKLNSALPQEQINKLIRKIQKKSPNVQSMKKLGGYDQEKLKKIVEAHSGIYKADIIQKLNQRKLEKQKRHEIQMKRILQKYKANDPAQANSASSFNKSNQSVPHLHKVQGYAKINKIKKYSDLNHNPKRLQQFLMKPSQNPKSTQKLKTQPKIQQAKPYFRTKGQQNDSQNVQNIEEPQKKPQILRQLSLPRLPKRKMRQQSIYQALKLIDTKSDVEFIKKLIDPTSAKEDEKILDQFYSKEKLLIEKQKSKKPTTLQNRMKFT